MPLIVALDGGRPIITYNNIVGYVGGMSKYKKPVHANK